MVAQLTHSKLARGVFETTPHDEHEEEHVKKSIALYLQSKNGSISTGATQ
jgi:hypothetical protein